MICPPGALFDGTSCYIASKIDNDMDKTEYQERCQAMSYHLVSPQSLINFEQLNQQLTAKIVPSFLKDSIILKC